MLINVVLGNIILSGMIITLLLPIRIKIDISKNLQVKIRHVWSNLWLKCSSFSPWNFIIYYNYIEYSCTICISLTLTLISNKYILHTMCIVYIVELHTMSDVCFGIKAIFAMSRHTPECRMAIKLVLYEPHFRNEF